MKEGSIRRHPGPAITQPLDPSEGWQGARPGAAGPLKRLPSSVKETHEPVAPQPRRGGTGPGRTTEEPVSLSIPFLASEWVFFLSGVKCQTKV